MSLIREYYDHAVFDLFEKREEHGRSVMVRRVRLPGVRHKSRQLDRVLWSYDDKNIEDVPRVRARLT